MELMGRNNNRCNRLGVMLLSHRGHPSLPRLTAQAAQCGAAGVTDACELARDLAPGRARGPGSKSRDSEAALLATRDVIFIWTGPPDGLVG